MKITKLGHMNVYSVMFETRKQLCRDLVRPQAYYESPGFIGRIFTVNEFYEDWEGTHPGVDYDDQWDGYNFPDTVLQPFRDGKFKDLNYAEKALIETIPEGSGAYIVGFHEGSPTDVVKHETIHACYFFNKSYRKKVNAIIRSYNKHLKQFKAYLYATGYSDSNVLDEINAYTVANYKYMMQKGIEIPFSMHDKLQDIYEKLDIK